MNEVTNRHSGERFEPTRSDEEARLETALYDSDRLLTDSLREDERRRRRRRLITFTLLIGGILMATLVVAVLAGWLTLVATAVAEGVSDEALAEKVPGRIVRTVPVTKDCMVLAYIPEWSHGDIDNIGVANNDGGVRTLLAWGPVPKDAVGSENRRAYLAVYSRKTTAAPEAGKIQIRSLEKEWAERTSWEAQPKSDDASEPMIAEFEPEEGWKLFDVTPLVERQPNAGKKGVVVKFDDESRVTGAGDWSGYEFVSREAESEWKAGRPRLLIVEVDPAKEQQSQTPQR